MIYKYFVSYNLIEGINYGFGNVEITIDNEIKNYEDISAVQDSIAKDKKHDGVIILNYILLSKGKGSI